MAKELPSIIYKIEERSYYDKFAKQMIKHFRSNIDLIETKMVQGELKQLRPSFKHRLYFDSNRRVNKISLEFLHKGLFIDLGVGRGVKLQDVGYQKIGRTLLGRKVKKRRAGRWYLKTAYGQTIRLMGIVAKQRGDEYTVIIQRTIEGIGKVEVNI